MATEVLIPKLGMTMTEGIVAEWHIADGAEVRKGQSVYRLETEKIEFEVEAEVDGVVRHLVRKGTKLAPGAVVAYILGAGEASASASPVSAAGLTVATGLASGRVDASPIARRLAKEAGLDLTTIAGSGPGGRIVEGDVLKAQTLPQPAMVAATATAGPILASPLARRLAETLGVDLGRLLGTGPGGRITKEDVERAAASPAAPKPSAPPAHAAGEVILMRAMRRTVAQRMHASLREMAQLTMGMEVDMTEAVKLRSQLIDEWAAERIRPSFTDLVIKAVARALGRHPLLNSQLTDVGIELIAGVHVGMAVALDDGLVVPVIRDADALPLRELALESTRLADGARAGKLSLDEMAGATFSVTALGMTGIDFFTPIINPPNVAILGVGRIHDVAAGEGDRTAKRQQMTLSLTIDHRVVDGAPGAAFLSTVRELLEAPYRLLV